jgi:hypothetical protein
MFFKSQNRVNALKFLCQNVLEILDYELIVWNFLTHAYVIGLGWLLQFLWFTSKTMGQSPKLTYLI